DLDVHRDPAVAELSARRGVAPAAGTGADAGGGVPGHPGTPPPSWGRDFAGAGRRTGPVVAVVSPLVEVPSELSREVNRLIGQVRHWTPARWAAPAADAPDRSRGDLVHGLVQRLADRCAEAEGEPRRRVPRLDNDLALVDQ